ncbi:MAG: patatin-like phospholipase family protein [Deltaproteobacteria bacterium]|nr:patatin-like phospholipase family protein [Deltaproteobacteria bacterium]
MKARLRERFRKTKPLRDIECAVVRDALDHKDAFAPGILDGLRYGTTLARIDTVDTAHGKVHFGGPLDTFRIRLIDSLSPHVLTNPGRIDRRAVNAIAPDLIALTRRVRKQLLDRGQISAEALDREVGTRRLVFVLGGGGGTGFVFLGTFRLFEELGVTPSLIVGTSMGSVLGLFRARDERFRHDEIVDVASSVKWREVFRLFDMENRYGLPATLRLYLRRGIAHYFARSDGATLRLEDLAIPLRVVVTGLEKKALRHDIRYYEHLLDTPTGISGLAIRRRIKDIMTVVSEFLTTGDGLREIVLGNDPLTRAFDSVDAVGFSSAVPGVIHYDVIRDDPRMHALLRDLFEREHIYRLIDGGVTDNVPARVAWDLVERGELGSRNALIAAFDSFAPQLSRHVLFAPVQRLVRKNVESSRPYADTYHAFQRTLSPIELVPSATRVSRAARAGYAELQDEAAFYREMLRTIPPP